MMVRHDGRICWIDRIVLLGFFAAIVLFMAFFDKEGDEQRDALLYTLEDLHHEHCVDCEGHNHDPEHYKGIEHQKEVEHAKQHEELNRLEKLLLEKSILEQKELETTVAP